MNIYEKLIEVRKEVPYLKKENGGNGIQYKFVSSSQVLGNLKQKMDDLGLLLIPEVIKGNHTILQNKTNSNGNPAVDILTELEMQFIWINAEKPEEQIACRWYGQGVDSTGEKGVGKALTYAEKYFMLKFFNIATDKDDPDAFQNKHGKENNTDPTSEDTFNELANSKPQPEKLKCPGCGGKITDGAMNQWGKCIECKKKSGK